MILHRSASLLHFHKQLAVLSIPSKLYSQFKFHSFSFLCKSTQVFAFPVHLFCHFQPCPRQFRAFGNTVAVTEIALEENKGKDTFFADETVSWSSLGVSDAVSRALSNAGIERPSSIQAASIPAVLSGGDAVIAAETGSGKTHCYLVPLIDKLCVRDCSVNTALDKEPYLPQKIALVLCPNVLLCEQVVRMANSVCGDDGKSLGWPVHKPDIIVTTPAALLNYINPNKYRRFEFLHAVKHVVFDEADMLLCGGLQNKVIHLINMFRLDEKQLSQSKDVVKGLADEMDSEMLHSSISDVLEGPCRYSTFSCKTKLQHSCFKTISSEFRLARLSARCYSTKKGRKSASKSLKGEPVSVMEQGKEKDVFFVVRKGDVVGVFKSLTECQAQVGSSICDPPVSVYKGFSLPTDTAEYLAAHGLKNAAYTIRAADLKEDLFGTLAPCPFLDPASTGNDIGEDASRKRLKEDLGSEKKTCILEFDGASKGNPGQAGAGAILRANNGELICRLREGLGVATNNVAEYRAIILGMRQALDRGFTSIRVHGDSKLVCMQVQGLWKVKDEKISNLHKEVKKLKDKFLSFQISHVLRNSNAEADALANLAIHLDDGIVEECGD